VTLFPTVELSFVIMSDHTVITEFIPHRYGDPLNVSALPNWTVPTDSGRFRLIPRH